MVSGTNLREIPCPMSLSICEACIEGEHFIAAFLTDMRKQTNKMLDIAHLDVFGHVRVVVSIDDCMSSGSDLEMHPSRT